MTLSTPPASSLVTVVVIALVAHAGCDIVHSVWVGVLRGLSLHCSSSVYSAPVFDYSLAANAASR